MKKWITPAFSIVTAFFLLVGCGTTTKTTSSGSDTSNSSKPIVLKLGHVLPSSEIQAQAAEKFAAEVEKKSNGRLKIQVFANGTLGTDSDVLNGLKTGSADIWLGGAGNLNPYSQTAKIFTVPFMFNSQAQFDKAYNGKVGQDITKAIDKESGYHILTYWARGARWLTADKPVKTPDDLKGLKLRVPTSPVVVKSWTQLGAAATPMDFTQVYTALQQRVIDGQENPLSLISSAKLYEVQKYLMQTNHVREPIVLVIYDKTLNKLSPDLQKVLFDAANGTAKQYAVEQVQKGDDQFKQELTTKDGMKLIIPDIKKFQSKLSGFVDKNFPELSPIYKEIEDSNHSN